MRLSKFLLASSILILSAGSYCCRMLPAQSSSAPAASASEPIRVYSREVLVDINVTDAKGNPVHGLTQANFSVLEDGKPIVPRSFVEHRADQNKAGSAAPSGPPLPPNTFSNSSGPEVQHPLNILIIDSLNTPMPNQAIVQKRMVEFVEKMPAGTPVAVMGLSGTGQLTMIQPFTSEPDLLKKAIKSRKLEMQVPPLEDAGQEPEDQPQIADQENKRVMKAVKSAQPPFDQSMECNHAAARGQYTIQAMTEIARYLSGMPGRKNVIWYSGAFPTRMKDKQGGFCYDFKDDVAAAGSLLSHAHVALYPVDPRAMDILAKEGPTSRIGREENQEHLTMEAVAEETGGTATYNSNDLAAAALHAVDAGSNFYTITYTPSNQNNDTRFRTISVKVDQPDLTLLYKPGYHAVPPGTTLRGGPVEKATPVQSAMMRGTLEPSEILFHVGVATAAATDAVLPAGNKADPKMKPPYRHLTLSYLIDINGIQFDPQPDGTYHGQFEFAVNVYDPNDGKLLNSNDMVAKPAVPAAAYQSWLTSGAKIRQEIDIPAKGDYILRIGVHDITTDHVGALEIPVSALK